MLFRRYIRKQVIRILDDINSCCEEGAIRFADDYTNKSKYKSNPYHGPFYGYVNGAKWACSEILKRI